MSPEVTVEQGRLRGSTGRDAGGKEFLKFQGIPYAKPPFGQLRFKAPVPVEKWDGVLDATKERDICYSRNPFRGMELAGSEDCLFLNVYTQRLPETQEDVRPVLFWIHGGGFVFGFGNESLYGPDFLLVEDVVLVTINYRLGFFGFLSFEDPSLDVPGNAGLKDQVMALRWVQNNIRQFGGDPDNVTIFGQSAGASAVHLLMLSPMGKGLFHRAIAQSGCALNPWVYGNGGSKMVAKALGLQDERSVYEALMSKTTEEVMAIQEGFPDFFLPNELRPVGLVIEKNSSEPFLEEDPLKILSSGKFTKVPFLTGYTSREGMCFVLFKVPGMPEPDIKTLVPWFFKYNPEEVELVAQKIQDFYFGNSNDPLDQKFDLLTDCQFLHGLHLTILTLLKHLDAPLYLYKVTIETELNFLKKFLKIERPGVSHCDDNGYLFKTFATPEVEPGSVEDVASGRFVKMWTNFAKCGNPSTEAVSWEPVVGEDLEYLEIGGEWKMESNPDFERMKFWKDLWVKSPGAGAGSFTE